MNTRRRIRKGDDLEEEAENDENVDQEIIEIRDLLILSNRIYSLCHALDGYLTGHELISIEHRSGVGLSPKTKLQILEARLIYYLYIFKGLGS